MNRILRQNPFLFVKKLRSLSNGQILRHKSAKAQSSLSLNYKVGDEIYGFKVNQIQRVDELNLTAYRLSHIVTGADYLHFARDDSNNLFAICFRTVPRSHDGVAHILEHTTLCGSEQFPVRDPFFKMLNRSLSTFMNAFTMPDCTVYPFSTQNAKDFRNLLSVYLDAVFSPKLKELDFSQEGWRLEYDDANDSLSPLVFKGVVYNEMKGQLADSRYVFGQYLHNSLLPAHTYQYVSGGDPKFIPDLTWNQLRDFHAKHYHPSNCFIFSYGDMPLDRHLEYVNETLVKKKFARIQPDTEIPSQPRWKEPKRVHFTTRVDPLLPDRSKNTSVCKSYLLNDITDVYETIVMSILGDLLTSGPASPFYQSLLEPNLGLDYTTSTGYEGYTRDASFSVGLRGIDQSQVENVLKIIDDTFENVVKTGFPQERIDAVLHKVELGLKHEVSNFGLHLVMSSLLPTLNHRGDPISTLRINENLEKFKSCLKENPRYLQEKVAQYFIKNTHQLTLTCSEDKDFESKLASEEEQILKNRVDKLSKEDKERIYETGLELQRKQNEEQDISCLPTLAISDIDRSLIRTEVRHEHINRVPVQIAEQPTNGVTYFRAVLDASGIPQNLRPLLPTFCNLLTEMGTANMDYKTQAKRIELTTGGLSCSTMLTEHYKLPGYFEQAITLSSYCIQRNVTEMFSLWSDILNHIAFSNNERLITLIRSDAASTVSGVAQSGHNYALMQAASGLSASSAIRQSFSGMDQVLYLKHIASDSEVRKVADKLKDLANVLLRSDRMRCAINASPEDVKETLNHLEKLVGSMKSRGTGIEAQEEVPFIPKGTKTYYKLPIPISYVAKSVPTVPYSHNDFASLQVLARYMSNKFLHKEIREKGGAYGSGASQDLSGNFMFYSYRDPRSVDTLGVFNAAVEWVSKKDIAQQDLDEAKLSTFSAIDKPLPPGQRGLTGFLYGRDDDLRQQHRDRLFEVTRGDLVRAAETYLANPKDFGAAALGPGDGRILRDPNWKMFDEEGLLQQQP